MRIELAYDVVRIGDLHGMVAQEARSHNPFVEPLAGSLTLGAPYQTSFSTLSFLDYGGFTLSEEIKMHFILAAHHLKHKVEKLLTSCSPALFGRLDRLDAKSMP